jgi:hypothetical protein
LELLRELAADPDSPFIVGGDRRPGDISSGRSFHSVSGRWFWKDCPDEGLLLNGGREGGVLRGGPPMGGRLTALAVALGGTFLCNEACEDDEDVVGRALRTDAGAPAMSRLRRNALSGRSFR